MNYLASIIERKRKETASRSRFVSMYLKHNAFVGGDTKQLAEHLRRSSSEWPNVIAEIKFCSPSAGPIRKRAPGKLIEIAQSYERGGASAISVLCDRAGFCGSPLDLRRVRSVTRTPLLFKEFVLDEVQLHLARAMGASYVLLLVCVLDQVELVRLIVKTRELGMEAVVECASAEELSRVLDTSATIVGINSRDLRSFSVDSQRAKELVQIIPDTKIAVYMSGIKSKEEFQAMRDSRVDAVLMGESLMRQNEPDRFLSTLFDR
ncbi:MAG: indole-3-glycerol-phosphate synthase [Myxococcales bacterium]|nr:MAG: indole-3-glycerol-phosphate synthase [Myxococcales bacterium]